MAYVDGFLLAVPTARREEYLKLCAASAPVFKDHGALAHVECWGDDITGGEVTSFPMAVQLKEGESVVFSWITWPSRAARDEGMKKAMEDPRLAEMMDLSKAPFDAQRMLYGGFEVLFEA